MAKKLPLEKLPDWPLLMDINEAARYLGMSPAMFRKHQPAEPLHIGNKTVRYHIDDLKRWASMLKLKEPKSYNRDLIDRMYDD